MLTISNYHYIRENFDAAYPSIFGVTPTQFRLQLELLKNEGDLIAPQMLLENPDAILQSKDRLLLVTFDDGLKEQFDLALPILDSLDIPAVFFANSRNREQHKISAVHQIHLLRSVLSPSDFLKQLPKDDAFSLSDAEQQRAASIYLYDTPQTASLKYLLNFKMPFDVQEKAVDALFGQHFSHDEVLDSLYMTVADLKTLAHRSYLGSHTHSHYPLGLLQPEAMRFELEHSKKYLEDLCAAPINMIAYPYGTPEACDERVAQAAKNAGYEIGFTAKRGANVGPENKLLLNRFDCNDLPGGKNFKGWK